MMDRAMASMAVLNVIALLLCSVRFSALFDLLGLGVRV
jgi:hypothetical protein